MYYWAFVAMSVAVGYSNIFVFRNYSVLYDIAALTILLSIVTTTLYSKDLVLVHN